MIIQYDKTKGFNSEDWNKIVDAIREISESKWEVEIRKPRRTPRQNRTIHALFPALATELNGLGVSLCMGKIKCSFTEITAKEFFKEAYLGGKGTSQCTTKELAEALNAVIHDVNIKGGQLAIKDEALNQLLASVSPPKKILTHTNKNDAK